LKAPVQEEVEEPAIVDIVSVLKVVERIVHFGYRMEFDYGLATRENLR
jgi:hypothetical protein